MPAVAAPSHANDLRPRFHFGTNGQFLDVKRRLLLRLGGLPATAPRLGDRQRMDMSDRRCRDADDVL